MVARAYRGSIQARIEVCIAAAPERSGRSARGARTARRYHYRDSYDRLLSTETGTAPDGASGALTILSWTEFVYMQ